MSAVAGCLILVVPAMRSEGATDDRSRTGRQVPGLGGGCGSPVSKNPTREAGKRIILNVGKRTETVGLNRERGVKMLAAEQHG